MDVEDIETVRGHPAYHTVFDVRGGLLFYHVNDHYESWFDTTTLVSLHHTQSVDQNGKRDDRTYDFYPERQVYVRDGQENPSVADPLDEGSFIYFMRSIPLEVGKTYEFNRYYHPDRNPVIIKVERRERVTVPAGTSTPSSSARSSNRAACFRRAAKRKSGSPTTARAPCFACARSSRSGR